MPQTKPYKCVLCLRTFTEDDAEKYNFFRATRVCFDCYNEGQKKPHDKWCFGKRDKVVKGRTVGWGFHPTRASSCTNGDCHDTRICKAFLVRKKDGKRYRKIDRIRAKK